MTHIAKPAAIITLAGFVLALLGCYLPWVDHPAAALAPNSFDLAEWTSLHPAARVDSPALKVTFLLRAPVALIAIGLALSFRWGWVPALAIAVVLLPPFEFFRGAGGDPNYRQQFALAAGIVVFTLTGAFLTRYLRPRLFYLERTLQFAPIILAGASAAWGMSDAFPLVTGLYNAGRGIGLPVTLAGLGLAAVGIVLSFRVPSPTEQPE